MPPDLSDELDLARSEVERLRAALAAERARGATPGPRPPIRPAAMTLREVRQEAARLLPGCTVRRLLFWRYLLVFRRPRNP